MPVFEYKCSKCDVKFEILHKSAVKQEEVSCPACDSNSVRKLFSSFSPSVHSHSHESPCANGNCNVPSPGFGCSGGSCGLN
jgi:putative FmdB family regulatory protein